MKKLAIFTIPIIILIVIFSSAFAKPYKFEENKSTDLINKIFEAEDKGELNIKDTEINGLINTALENKREFSGIAIEKANVKFSNNKIGLVSQLQYKNVMLQGYVEGALEFKNQDEDIYFKVDKIKLGYLPLPKNFILSKVKDKRAELFTPDGRIKISKEYFPYDIKNISLNDDKIKITFEKRQSILFADINEVTKNINNNSLNKEDNQNGGNQKQSDNKTQQNTNKTTNKTSNKITSNNNSKPQNNQRVAALNKLNSQLSTVAAKLQSQNQKRVIYTMQSTVNNLIKNPNYNYSKDIGRVRAVYDELTSEEKMSLKQCYLQM